MNKPRSLSWLYASLVAVACLASPAHASPAPADGTSSTLPFPFGSQLLPDGTGNGIAGMPRSHGAAGNPGVTAPLVTPPPKPQADNHPKTRKEFLDALFDRLSHADDQEEADGIALAIQHVWLESGSDTADLLMTRALTANDKGDSALAIRILDSVIALDPDWAEAWDKRATLRFLANDDAGSMEDIAHVLKLEPRHFGAMTGMASILLHSGMKKEALAVLRNAAGVYPHNDDMQKLIKELVPEVDGRDI